MPAFAHDVGEEFFAGRPTIGVWWWEVDPYPVEEWAPALQWLDELWVGTDFIRGLIEPHVDVPVWVFPVPVSQRRLERPLDRAHFGWNDDETIFLYIWDYHSTEARKNPSGLVEAYRRAFPEGSKTRLVLKCINHENLPEADEKVRVAAIGRDDIVIIDRFISADEKRRPARQVRDCYVSPHRSEGFGYTPAEAMLLGKPVVMTGYGGTRQYADDTVARIVKWTPSRVGRGALPYPPEGRWADPDLDDLAAALRWIVEQPEAAAGDGRTGSPSYRRATRCGRQRHRDARTPRSRCGGGRQSLPIVLRLIPLRRIARRLERNRLAGRPTRGLHRAWRSLTNRAAASSSAESTEPEDAAQRHTDATTQIEDDSERLASRLDETRPTATTRR